MNEAQIGEITTAIAVLGTLSMAYGAFVGPRQTELVQAIIDVGKLHSRYRPAVNFLTGIVLAVILSVFLAMYVNDWRILAVGIVAGVFASQKAAETHDTQKKVNDVVTVQKP